MAELSKKEPPSRKPNRMVGKNYNWNGAYFITVCTKGRHCFFGEVQNKKMILSDIGKIAAETLSQTEAFYPSVILDSFVVMPNHVHLLIILLSERHNPAIQRLMQQWKGVVTKKAEFPLWQDRFDDRIIYSAAGYRKIKQYIQNNPTLWEKDQFYGPNPGPDSQGP